MVLALLKTYMWDGENAKLEGSRLWRVASHARNLANRVRNYHMKKNSLHAWEGRCQAANCQQTGLLSLCHLCSRWVCDGCRRRKFHQCLACYEIHPANTYVVPSTIPQDAPANQCYSCFRPAERCGGLVPGRCFKCNRYLCQGCAAVDLPLCCVVCPAKNRQEKTLHTVNERKIISRSKK